MLQTLLGLGVILLAGGMFLLASGGIGPVLDTLTTGIGSAFGRLVATPVPTSTDLPPTDSPRIASPEQPYTNQGTVDLNLTVPAEAVGDANAKVRIYLALEGLQPTPVRDVPIGTTSRIVASLQLTPGRNDFSATLFRGDAESEPSPIVTWFYDTEPPKITITSPKDGAHVDKHEATIKGSTQAGTTMIARNAANNTSISTVAARDGSFEFSLPLDTGENAIVIDGTDPAGNAGKTTLTIVQGSTRMAVRLSASTYRISVSKHPSSLQLVVRVTDPSGEPLQGAHCSFTLLIPGLDPISYEADTGLDGRAAFTTPLVGTLSKGGGVGTVLVTHDDYGESSDRVNIDFVK